MKGPALTALEELHQVEKSPTQSALIGAIKGAIIGAPAGAVVSHLSGGSASAGGFIGGLLAAAAFGAANAITKDVENKEQESALRVHLENLKDREPFFYMPPKPLFERLVKHVR